MKRFLQNALRLALPIVLIFGALDLAIIAVSRNTGVLQDVVDIQTPAVLYAKLDHLRTYDGRRIVFVGDSVVYGRRMEETGDAGWRDHTVPAHVESLLQVASPRQNFLAMNLAMNGALPADIEQVVRLMLPLKPDCIVTDVSLRSFSADFAPEASRLSRSWLANMRIDSDFNLHTERAVWDTTTRYETALQNFARSHWLLYRMRDFVQWRVFNSEPSEAVRRLRDRVDQRLGAKAANAGDELDDILLTLKAKSRHDSVTMAGDNPQVAALKRTLDLLANARQCALFFYATEDKTQIAGLMEAQRYRQLQAELAQIFSAYASRGITYIPPLDSIRPEYYLDYGHLNDTGNLLVAKRIVEGGLGKAVGNAAQAH